MTEPAAVAERAAYGRATRSGAPRSSHAGWTAPPNRVDPVAVLQAQAETRVPELVPVRHDRMLVSPFAFYRGAAAIMANDLAATPTSGLRVQCCGDAHLANFGVFASPERTMVFDINDFDETLPGPWEWDVKRLAASVVVAAQDREFDAVTTNDATIRTVRSYRTAMRQFATMTNLDVWYAHLDVTQLLERWSGELPGKGAVRVEREVERARGKTSLKALAKLTERVDGEIRIVNDPPLVVRAADLYPDLQADAFAQRFRQMLHAYQRTVQPDRRHLLASYRFVDLARKVVGVGSVGTRCWIVLMLGRDDSDPLFLQVKEAQASVLEANLPKSEYAEHGQRVVEGQRLMQAASDIFLGWQRVDGFDDVSRDFYLRQLWDGKASVDLTTLRASALATYGEVCGWTLARAHARSGDRIAIAAYLGSSDGFDRAIVEFALAYAEQNRRDFDEVTRAARAGRLPTTVTP